MPSCSNLLRPICKLAQYGIRRHYLISFLKLPSLSLSLTCSSFATSSKTVGSLLLAPSTVFTSLIMASLAAKLCASPAAVGCSELMGFHIRSHSRSHSSQTLSRSTCYREAASSLTAICCGLCVKPAGSDTCPSTTNASTWQWQIVHELLVKATT